MTRLLTKSEYRNSGVREEAEHCRYHFVVTSDMQCCGSTGIKSTLMRNNHLKPLINIGTDHFNPPLQFGKWERMRNQWFETHNSALYQVYGTGIVFTLGGAGIEQRKFLEIELVKRKAALSRGINSEQ